MAVLKVVSKRQRGSVGDRRSSNHERGWPRGGVFLILPIKCAFWCTFRAILHSQLHGGQCMNIEVGDEQVRWGLSPRAPPHCNHCLMRHKIWRI